MLVDNLNYSTLWFETITEPRILSGVEAEIISNGAMAIKHFEIEADMSIMMVFKEHTTYGRSSIQYVHLEVSVAGLILSHDCTEHGGWAFDVQDACSGCDGDEQTVTTYYAEQADEIYLLARSV